MFCSDAHGMKAKEERINPIDHIFQFHKVHFAKLLLGFVLTMLQCEWLQVFLVYALVVPSCFSFAATAMSCCACRFCICLSLHLPCMS